MPKRQLTHIRPTKWLAGLLLLLALSNWSHSAWLTAKAYLAQHLIAHAWQSTLNTGKNTKPWPWADTWPVARLQAPAHNIDWLVLAGSHGSSLAFGPGHIDGTALGHQSPPNTQHENNHIIISGHRDTHFQFLEFLTIGDELRLQGKNGHWQSYTMQRSTIKNIQHGPLLIDKTQTALSLITCYPFNAITPGGPERLVISALPKKA